MLVCQRVQYPEILGEMAGPHRIAMCYKKKHNRSEALSFQELASGPQYSWPFQEPKLEVPTIYKAYVRAM